jgi:hypothetical protein
MPALCCDFQKPFPKIKKENNEEVYIFFSCFRMLVAPPYAPLSFHQPKVFLSRLRLKCSGTRAETRFRLSAKQTSPFKSAVGGGGGASVQSTTGSRGVRISGSNAGYTMFRSSVKSTGYPLHSPLFPLYFPCLAPPCAITFQLDSTNMQAQCILKHPYSVFFSLTASSKCNPYPTMFQ